MRPITGDFLCHFFGNKFRLHRSAVKTLAIRNTFEEKMVARRAALRTTQEVPNVIEEDELRDYIAVSFFLYC